MVEIMLWLYRAIFQFGDTVMLKIGDVVKIGLPQNPTANNRVGNIMEIDNECYDETVYLVKYFNQCNGYGWFTKEALININETASQCGFVIS